METDNQTKYEACECVHILYVCASWIFIFVTVLVLALLLTPMPRHTFEYYKILFICRT